MLQSTGNAYVSEVCKGLQRKNQISPKIIGFGLTDKYRLALVQLFSSKLGQLKSHLNSTNHSIEVWKGELIMGFNNSRIPAAITGLTVLSTSVLTLGVPSIAMAQQSISTSEAALQQLVNQDFKATPVTQGLPSGCPTNPKNSREKALKQACGQVGYKEEPPGSNCNKFSKYFNKGCQAWCADFVSWAFDSTGNKDKKLPWSNVSAVASIQDWAKKNNKVVKTPKPGDIFLINNGKESHTGLVLKVSGGTFTTVEGNAGSPSVSVTSGQRTVSKYVFVRPDNKAL